MDINLYFFIHRTIALEDTSVQGGGRDVKITQLVCGVGAGAQSPNASFSAHSTVSFENTQNAFWWPIHVIFIFDSQEKLCFFPFHWQQSFLSTPDPKAFDSSTL